MKSRIIFMSVAAAEMNLGDMFIRRALTKLLESQRHSVMIYTGSMGASYIEAFTFPETWSVVSSPSAFLRHLAGASIRRRATIIMAPAPASLDHKGFRLLKHVALALLLSLCASAGNQIVVVGRAVRGTGKLATLAEKLIARVSALYIARDQVTVDKVGGVAEFRPDFGFAPTALRIPFSASQTESARRTVAVSFRREPDVLEVRRFVASLQDRGFDVVAVTQVREDSVVNQFVADNCGISHVDWPESRSHLAQEASVIGLYSKCCAVVSDRLHALIIGGRYGAIPVMVERVREDKLHATLDVLLAPQTVRFDQMTRSLSDNELALTAAEQERVQDAVGAACAQLEETSARVIDLVGESAS